jgi:hypothetical protein
MEYGNEAAIETVTVVCPAGTSAVPLMTLGANIQGRAIGPQATTVAKRGRENPWPISASEMTAVWLLLVHYAILTKLVYTHEKNQPVRRATGREEPMKNAIIFHAQPFRVKFPFGAS